jgi:mono/diheme cytochrome c family protein
MRAIILSAVVAVSLVLTVAAQDTRVPPTQNAPTFSKDVAPILYSKCITCHRPGEVAPMSLITFRDVRPWARAIRDKVSARTMPPWFADPAHGTFKNDRSLTQAQIDTIVKWVDADARQGDPAQLPPLPAFTDGWQIGKPDVVYEMPTEFHIPADGTVDYQYFEVPTNFAEDRWIVAGEVRAGNREHVHHIIVSVIEPSGNSRPAAMSVRAIADGTDAAPRAARQLTDAQRAQLATAARRANAVSLVNWAVGEDAPVYPSGMGKRIPAGSTLQFQVHYTTNGAPATDRSKIGLIFAKEPPKNEMRTALIANTQFAIPAGDNNHTIEAEATFTQDVKVWNMHPHMHLRGKDMTYTAIYPDGRQEIVLRVPKYDFGWQTDYALAQPLSLPKGSKLHVTAHYDNSPANRANPDPTAVVRWGDQTWEEMMIGYITYTVDGAAVARTVAQR